MSDPMDLVSHVNRSKSGMTKMQVQLSIEMRAGMAEASKRLGMSQLSLIRSAISAFLQAHAGLGAGGDILADSRNLRGSPREVAPLPDVGPAEQGPVPVVEPLPNELGARESVAEPEPDQSTEPTPGPGPETPKQALPPKRSPRGPGCKKGGQS